MADFDPIASTLRQALVEYYRLSGERVALSGWHNTLETNSGFVVRRAGALVDEYLAAAGRTSLERVRVLDVGCGFGALAVYLASLGATVHGIDPNPRRLAVGREVAAVHRLPVSLRPGRMEALVEPDASVDLVLFNNSLCYVLDWEDRRRALAHALRVLRPGGHVLVRNPNRLAVRDQFTGLPGVHLLSPSAADTAMRAVGRRRSSVRLLSPRAARRELEEAGFTDVASSAPPGSRAVAAPALIANYQHLVGRRP